MSAAKAISAAMRRSWTGNKPVSTSLRLSFELRVTPHKARGFDDIGMTIAQFDEVDTVLLMSGSYDLQVIIKGRSFQEIAIFVAKRLSPLDDVLSTATSFCSAPLQARRPPVPGRRTR